MGKISADVKKMLKQFDHNEKEVMLMLGYAYWNGEGINKSKTKAIEVWTKGSELGNGECSYHLGELYEKGLIVDMSANKARTFYQASASQGYLEGIYKTGYCFEYGFGVYKDLEKAADYYKKAARMGSQKAKDALLRLDISIS